MKKAEPNESIANQINTCVERGKQPKAAVYTYQCKLVTPLYGGGVNPGEVDISMPIRSTAIRGQLRFWWRLLNRKRFADSNEMYIAERMIWGGLGDANNLTASHVVLRVKAYTRAKVEPAAKYKTNNDGRLNTTPEWENWAGSGYVLFPAQGKTNQGRVEIQPKKLLPSGYRWILELNLSRLNNEQKDSVTESIQWWATFGGVGARTRRGVGAIEVSELLDGKPILIDSVTVEKVKSHQLNLYLSPHPATKDVIEAWNNSEKLLRDYRQKSGIGRNEGRERGRPGRSRWPEPDAIRRLSGNNSSLHKPEHPAENVFPRAAFGLPIIFHFKDQGDPRDTTLNPQGKERMASPLILRPYHTKDGWKSALLVLPVSEIYDMNLELTGGAVKTLKAGTWWPLKDKESDRRIISNKIKPLNLSGATHPLAGFIKFFKNNGKPEGNRA